MDKAILYIGHFLPGNEGYEKKLLRELSNRLSNHLDVISVSPFWPKNKEDVEWLSSADKLIWVRVKIPVLNGTLRFFQLLWHVLSWNNKNKKYKRCIIVQNCPVEVNVAIVLCEKMFGIKSVNLIIDTAIGNIKGKRLRDKYLSICCRAAEKLYKYLSGSILLNEKAVEYFGLNQQPYLITRIGYDNSLNFKTRRIKENRKGKKKIVYTGTLIDYDGTAELLRAMDYLDSNIYELYIYGGGPQEGLVMSNLKKNIIFGGMIRSEEVFEVLQEADLCINPRIYKKSVDSVAFPSKMIEYLLSGTPTLTTRFSALPTTYCEFVNFIDDQSGEGIAKAVEDVFLDDEDKVWNKAQNAKEYVYKHNNYKDIGREIVDFVFDGISK